MVDLEPTRPEDGVGQDRLGPVDAGGGVEDVPGDLPLGGEPGDRGRVGQAPELRHLVEAAEDLLVLLFACR